MKIEIITMHAARNYGAVLQTYALQKYCEQNGWQAEVLDYKRPNQTLKGYLFEINSKYKKNLFTRAAFLLKTFIPKIKTSKLFKNFLSKWIHLSGKGILSEKDSYLIPDADIYCVGSDQVWNPKPNNGLDPMFFWEGVTGNKISYASSIGLFDVDTDTRKLYADYLSDFRSVSVREQTSVELLAQCGIKADYVLDPTLMLNRDDWSSFAEGETAPNEPYLLVYFFGNAGNVLKSAKKIAGKKGLRIVRISTGFEHYSSDDVVERFVTPERFIALFLNASFVITNSFHGTIFSINFNKDFLSWSVTENNARFSNVLKLFDLENREMRKIENVENLESINYINVNEILEKERIHSKEYLFNSVR